MDSELKPTNETPAPSAPKYTVAELLRLIRTLPQADGMELIREHWALILPKEPGIDLAGTWGELQAHHTRLDLSGGRPGHPPPDWTYPPGMEPPADAGMRSGNRFFLWLRKDGARLAPILRWSNIDPYSPKGLRHGRLTVAADTVCPPDGQYEIEACMGGAFPIVIRYIEPCPDCPELVIAHAS